MKKLKYILQHNQYLIKYFAIFILVLSIIICNYYPFKSKYNGNTETIIGKILDYNYKDKNLTITLKAKEKIIINSYNCDNSLKEIIKLGNTIKVEGNIVSPKNNTIPGNFNYKKYLYQNKIYYIFESNNINLIKKNDSIISYFKQNINNYLSMLKSGSYIKTFILGNKKDIDEEVLESYQKNSLTHLFSISGMHISLLITALSFFLKRINYNQKLNSFIIMIFIFIYMLLTSFTPSILRSGIMYFLFTLNKSYQLKITTINILLLVLIIILLIDPFYLYNLGFQLSYLISSTIILSKNKIKKYKHYLTKSLYISYLSFITSYPIIINNFYEVNPISIIYNIFFIPIISFIILPISFLTFVFPILDLPLYYLTKIIENTSLFLSNINIFTITFAKPSLLLIIIYYIIIIITIINYKYIFIFFLITTYHQIKVYFNNTLNIIMLDVNQGDSILITLPYNKGNILFDTGGSIYKTYEDSIITYLKKEGIKKLDYLIITHGDNDHIASAQNLVNKFKINNTIINNGNINKQEYDLISTTNNIPISQKLVIDKYTFFFLNNKIYDNENENSIITYFKYHNFDMLLMGDATINNEYELLKQWDLKNVEVLKVGHHGSKTSSFKDFIETINPKISLISVGTNNIYRHPHQITLDNLKTSKIYQTNINGSILIKVKQNNYTISSYPP